MQDIIKQWPILNLLPMCTTDAGLSIMFFFLIYSYVMMTLMNTFSIFTLNRKQSSLSLKSLPAIFIHPFFYDVIMLKFHQIIIKMFIGIFLKKHTSVDELN